MLSLISDAVYVILFLALATIAPAVYADTNASSPAKPALTLKLAENNIERNARCNGQRQACISQCSVLPQVSTCRQSCETQYQRCIKVKPIIE